MTLFLLFVSAQMAGNGIACLIAAAVWHITRPRIVDIGKASRRRQDRLAQQHCHPATLDGVGSYAIEVEPC